VFACYRVPLTPCSLLRPADPLTGILGNPVWVFNTCLYPRRDYRSDNPSEYSSIEGWKELHPVGSRYRESLEEVFS